MSTSLIVPAYNEEDVIEDTLDHLKELEPYFDEIYLMDDASTDSTQERIETYLQENDTNVKVAYMRENGDKVGAIEEAVRHTDTDNVVLTDADTRIVNPEKLADAEDYLEENDYGAIATKMTPKKSEEGIWSKILTGFQDIEYAIGRSMYDFTTGERLRSDPEDKNIRCIPGPAGIYDADILEEALNHHSGGHAGDDMETTAIIQNQLDEDINYFNSLEVSTAPPERLRDLVNQRIRWGRGPIQTFSEHPNEHLSEVKSLSRHGQIIAGETALAGMSTAFIGKTAFDLANGDIAQAQNSIEAFYRTSGTLSIIGASYAIHKDEMNLKDSPYLLGMPFYQIATFGPATIGSQAREVKEKSIEAREAFAEGLEEGNNDLSRMRKLGRAFEKSKQKAEDLFTFGEEEDVNSMLEEDRQQTPEAAD